MKRLFILPFLILFIFSNAQAWRGAGTAGTLTTATVATLPSASASTNLAYIVIDGDDDADCTVGTGTKRNICISNGTAWVIAGDGAGSGSAFSTHDAPQGTDPVASGADTLTWAEGEAIDITGDNVADSLTIAAEDASTTNKGVLEIATDAEAVAVTATDKALVPSNIDNLLAEPPAIGGTTPAAAEFTTIAGTTITASDLITAQAGVTLNTGQNLTIGTDTWNTGDLINAEKVANDADLGDLATSSGVWSILEDKVDATALKDTDSPGDEQFYTYELTGTTGEWHTMDEMIVNLSEGLLPDDNIVEADLKAVDSSTDEDILTKEDTTGDFEWHSIDELVGTISAGALTDASVQENDLAQSLAFDDGDQIDLTGITYVDSATTNEGIALPTYVAGAAPADNKPYMAYDATNNAIMVYEFGGWTDTSSGTGASAAAPFLAWQSDGGLSAEQVLTAGYGIDVTLAGGDGGAATVAVVTTEISADGTDTWSNNSQASIVWTFDVTGTDHTMTAGDGLMTFGDAVTVTDTLTASNGIALGASKSITGTTTMTVGGGAENVVMSSANWGVDASGVVTAVGFTIGAAAITEAELEILDGATLGTADINIIDGVSDSGTLTAAELLHVDGVTSAIQTQLDARCLESVFGTALEADDLTLNGTTLELVAEIPHLDANDTITGNWVNTTSPWADNEVADTLTITAQSGSTWNVADSITTLSVYSGTTSLEQSTGATASGAYIIGVYDEFTNSNATNVQAVLNDLDGAIAAQATNYHAIGDPTDNGTISFGTYTGTYTSNQSAWDGIFISDTVAAVGADTELLTLSFTDSEGTSTGQLIFLIMEADNTTLVKFDETGLKIGTGTPTNSLDGGDVYITDNLEVDGTITAGGLSMSGNATPTWTWNDSDAAGGDAADENTMRVHANLDPTAAADEDDEIGNWRIDYMHDDGVDNNNAAYKGSLVWLGTDHQLLMGVLAYDNQADWTAGDEANYESLLWDFDAAEGEIHVTSPSSTALLDFQIATVVMDAVIASGLVTGNSFALGDTDYIGITGNEIITFNAAGSIVVSGASLDLTSGGITNSGTIADDAAITINSTGAGITLDADDTADQDILFKLDDGGTDWSVTLDGSEGAVVIGDGDAFDHIIKIDANTTDLTLTWDESTGTLESSHTIFSPTKSSAHDTNYIIGTDNTEEAYGGIFLNSAAGAITFTLPSAVAGMNVCVLQEQGDTGAITVQPATGDYIVYQGARSSAAADYWVSSGAAEDKLCLHAHDTTDWYAIGDAGTWTEE